MPNFCPKEKLRAIQFWNESSEHLQVIVNQCNEINALASYLQEQENNAIPIENSASTLNAVNSNTTEHHSINLQSEIPLLEKQNLDFAELAKQIVEPMTNTTSNNPTSETIGNSSSLAPFDLPSQASISMSNFHIPDTNAQCLDDINLTSIIDNNNLQSIASRTNEIPSTQRKADLHLFNYEQIARKNVKRSTNNLHPNMTSTVTNSINSVPTSLCDGLTSSTHSSALNANAAVSDNSAMVATDTLNTPAPIATTGKQFACSQCNQTFVSKSNLVVHEKLHTGQRHYACDQCSARFSSSSNLKRHQITHTGAKNFICEHCGSKFTAKKTLAVHIRKHTGERPYKCNFCGKCFAQNSVWKAHLKTHSDDKEYECHVCNFKCKQKTQLRLHCVRHQSDRKWECGHCESKFVTNADLKRHSRTHTGEKRFVCELCGKYFTRQQTLNEHSNRHYGIRPYSCDYCNKQFPELSGFRKVKKPFLKFFDSFLNFAFLFYALFSTSKCTRNEMIRTKILTPTTMTKCVISNRTTL